MFKKNSWIVALLLALTLTAFFTGCVEALAEEDAEYEEVELGEFNVWGGQNYQRGWSSGGLKFLGVGDKPEVAKDKGYETDNFIKATKLKIEMEDSGHPYGNVNLIWGAADESGNSVGYDWVQSGNLEFKKDGNTIILNLTDMKDYAKYKEASTGAKRKLIIQAGGESAGLPKLVVRAWLMIPTKEAPFVSVEDITLKKLSGFTEVAFELKPEFTPANATEQNISWSIFKTAGTNTANADFAEVNTSFITPGNPQTKNKLWATSAGTVKIRATISNAVYDKDEKKYVAFKKDFTITFEELEPFKIKVDGVEQQVFEYATKDNQGADSVITPTSGKDGYIVDLKDDYSNALYYFRVDLGDTLADYVNATDNTKTGRIKFKFKGLDGDWKNKDHIRVVVNNEPFPDGYMPIYWLAQSKQKTVEDPDIDFDVALGYNQIKDDTTLAPSAQLGNAYAKLKDESVLYFCIYFNSTKVKFQITDIELVKKQ